MLHSARDPAKGGGPARHWFKGPSEKNFAEVELTDLVAYLNALGNDGWEVVGMPSRQSAVFTYKAASEVYHDQGLWVEQQYLFKRRKG